MEYFQQGDVLIKPIEKLPTEKSEFVETGVLAYGEVTGHSHKISDYDVESDNPSVEVLKILGSLYVVAKKEWTVRHEEHHPIVVPPGTYKIGIVREYDHFSEEARSVAD